MVCSVVLHRDATRYVGLAAPKNRPSLIARLILVPLLVAVCAGWSMVSEHDSVPAKRMLAPVHGSGHEHTLLAPMSVRC